MPNALLNHIHSLTLFVSHSFSRSFSLSYTLALSAWSLLLWNLVNLWRRFQFAGGTVDEIKEGAKLEYRIITTERRNARKLSEKID